MFFNLLSMVMKEEKGGFPLQSEYILVFGDFPLHILWVAKRND